MSKSQRSDALGKTSEFFKKSNKRDKKNNDLNEESSAEANSHDGDRVVHEQVKGMYRKI